MRVFFLSIATTVLVPFLSTATQNQSLFLDDPALMEKLGEHTYSFPGWLQANGPKKNNFDLYSENAAYRSIVDSISGDLDKILKNDSNASTSMAKAHRVFHKKWLKAKSSRYELVGIVNRLDRRDFHPNTCGELRFIYRLSYKIKKSDKEIVSRLPLTFNVVLFYPKGSCKEIARQWQVVSGLGEKKTLEYLLSESSPLKFAKEKGKLKSIELNLQSVRWPSTVRPDMGGYAEYFLRVFQREGEKFVLSPLENTPDVEGLSKNPKQKKELLDWILRKENLESLDNGTLVVPDRFLAKKASSVALHGRAREFNKVFSRIFDLEDFKSVDFSQRKSIKSPYAVLARLNDMSCVGCHQGRTVAGFHFLGRDGKEVSPVNAIMSSFSPHFMAEQIRRKNYLNALADEKEVDSYRAFSTRSQYEKGVWGAHCSTGRDPSFSAWNCEKGLSCKTYDLEKNSPLGICVEATEAGEGGHCQVGDYKENSNPEKDRISNRKLLSCRDGLVCEKTAVGFPGGMCSGSCRGLGKDATCGSIAILFGFNQCLGKGKAFETCLEENVRPGALRACNDERPCRDDYICAKTKVGDGGCIPPYFLFQLRVDGHPSPI